MNEQATQKDSRIVQQDLFGYLRAEEKHSNYGNKHQGALYCQMFIVELMKRDWAVSVPIGDNETYDLIAGRGKRIVRIQVKGGGTNLGDGRYSFVVARGCDQKICYTSDDCDLIAIYVAAFNLWWIIPVESTIPVKAVLSKNGNSHYPECRNNWTPLETEAE